MEKRTEKAVQALKAHVALNVRDVEQSIEFYRKMLGIEPSKVRTGYAKFNVQNPPLNLTLNEVSSVRRGALSHMGIQVASTDDVLAVRRKWLDAGLVPRDEMQTNCCYAIQDKSWVSDPDGNEWEVFVVLEDNLAETSMCCVDEKAEHGSVKVPESCATETPSEGTSESSYCGTAAPVAISR